MFNHASPNAEEETIYIELKKLPSYAKLNSEVKKVVQESSWFERYGVDWLHLIGAVIMYIVGHIWLGTDSLVNHVSGILVLGCAHSIMTNKTGHMAVHGCMAESKTVNKILNYIFVDFMGCFSSESGYDIHIRSHHPHTNIIGLGDSATFKAPFLSTYIYMFVAPLLIPFLIPIVSINLLVENRWWLRLVQSVTLGVLGIWFNMYMLMTVSGLTLGKAVFCLWAYRAMFSIPYIHVNIFQHIGLPMYSSKSRPARIYQMSTGVLNLSRHPVLDWVFGHSLINCHVEHHLFPRLSDYMCLKVKPLVKEYLLEAGLPYHEKSYMDRVHHFLSNYETLMVKAPPITHFVGIQ